MQLTSSLFDELAKKEGLVFSEREKEELLIELNRMIRFVDKIRDVDTEDVEPLETIASVRTPEKEKIK